MIDLTNNSSEDEDGSKYTKSQPLTTNYMSEEEYFLENKYSFLARKSPSKSRSISPVGEISCKKKKDKVSHFPSSQPVELPTKKKKRKEREEMETNLQPKATLKKKKKSEEDILSEFTVFIDKNIVEKHIKRKESRSKFLEQLDSLNVRVEELEFPFSFYLERKSEEGVSLAKHLFFIFSAEKFARLIREGRNELDSLVKTAKLSFSGFQLTFILEGMDSFFAKKRKKQAELAEREKVRKEEEVFLLDIDASTVEDYKIWLQVEHGCHLQETKTKVETAKNILRLSRTISKSFYRDTNNGAFNFCVDSVHSKK